VSGPEPAAANSYEQPQVVRSQTLKGVEVKDGKAVVNLPPLSVAAISLKI
jgi:hypothetical protein